MLSENTYQRRSSERSKMAQFKPKKAAWSHQSDLIALKGSEVSIEMSDGKFTGTLLEADQFTVKLQTDQMFAGRKTSVVIFKSSIICFYELIAA